MAKKYYYAVKKGRKKGIFNTWDECKKKVIGFKDAKYKKFETLQGAKNFISEVEDLEIDIKPKDLEKLDNLPKDLMISYVDGSYNIKTKEYGCGVVIFTNEGKKTLSKKGTNEEYSKSRNVAGEILGAVESMELALEMGKKTLKIYYDYRGIEEWALGNWKTNNILTKNYKIKYDNIKKSLKVIFNKVEAHTGDKYNEEADILAKKSVGIE